MAKLKIGEAPKRIEDTRFLMGRGRYLDDLVFDGMVHAVFLRSSHAHAHLRGVDAAAARTAPGVLAVLTGADQDAAGIEPLQPYERVNVYSNEPFRFPTQYALAKDRVRYVGEPIALVVAESETAARDAAEMIPVDYDPLPALTTIEAALAPGAVSIIDDESRNICLEWQVGDKGATDAAMAAAAHVTRLDLHNHRVSVNPMEPRGAIGIHDPEQDKYTLHLSAQSLHMARDHVAAALGAAPSKVRFHAPDVGGGFGQKNFMYPEQVILLWAARVVGRPVKWVNARSEGFTADHPARDHTAQAELALDEDGNFLALRVVGWGNLGAYLCGGMARIHTEQFATLPGGPYVLPAVYLEVGAGYTNTVPIGVTRGPGFAESANILERLIDLAAAETGHDRLELRRRNLMPATAMPFKNTVGAVVDSGTFADNLAEAIDRAEAGFAERRSGAEARGYLRGLGFTYHIKATFGAPEENIEIRFDADDHLTFTTGTQSIGQGHETTFPQIVSALLGIPFERIRYRDSDTDLIAKGGGHGSSRATYMAGTAIHKAVQKIIAKGTVIAAQTLEAAETDIEFDDGQFRIAGTDRGIDILEVARLAREGDGESLDTYQDFTREAHTFPNGCHIAEVEVDPDTGRMTIERYTAVDDYGTIVNPMVIEGQVHGAIAQGLGQALKERVVYEASTGQLLTGSFMDYGLPRADEVPALDVTFNEIPCTTNPLGTKGSGEAGAIAGFPAIINAVLDALSPLGVRDFDGPATPENVWRRINLS